MDRDDSIKAGVSIRTLVTRCTINPAFKSDPLGVLANERDKMLDEINVPWVERVKQKEKME